MLRSPPWLGSPLWNICVTNDHGYVPLVVNTSRSFPHSRLITGFVTRLLLRVPLVEQELLSLPEHLSSPPVFSGIRVTRSLVLYVCFVDRCLSFGTFSFGHCVVYSSIYGFRLPLWYIQTLLHKEVRFYSIKLLNPATLNLIAYARPGKWAVMYVYVRGSDVALPLFLRFTDLTCELFWRCGIICSSSSYINKLHIYVNKLIYFANKLYNYVIILHCDIWSMNEYSNMKYAKLMTFS